MSIDARTCPVCLGHGSIVTGNPTHPETACKTCDGFGVVIPYTPQLKSAVEEALRPPTAAADPVASTRAPVLADLRPQSEWLGILAADAESRATLLVEALESGKALDREPKLLALDLHAAASLLVEALS